MIYDYIKQRLQSKGYDISDCRIEPDSIVIPNMAVNHLEVADNEFWFLHDLSNYEKDFTLVDDVSIYHNEDIIIDQSVPVGPIELTGNIRVITNDVEPLTLLVYKAIPGKKNQTHE